MLYITEGFKTDAAPEPLPDLLNAQGTGLLQVDGVKPDLDESFDERVGE